MLPGIFLVSDKNGRLREITLLGPQQPPGGLLKRFDYYRQKSLGSIFSTAIEGSSWLLNTQPVSGGDDQIIGYLTAVAALDERFLRFVLGGYHYKRHLVLIEVGDRGGRIFASSDLSRIPAGLPLSEVDKGYLLAGKGLLESSGSDLRLELATLIPRDRVKQLNRDMLGLSRQQRWFAAVVFIAAFSVLMFFSARRIDRLRSRIEGFMQDELQEAPRGLPEGDQISALERRFGELAKRVVLGREAMRHNYEMRRDLEQLETLQRVTDTLGVGVISVKCGRPVPVNAAMRNLAEECGGIERLKNLQDCERRVEIVDRASRRRVFDLLCLAVKQDESVVLVRDVTEVERQRAELEHHALHDALTDLPNRVLLSDRLSQALVGARRTQTSVCLALVGVNDFKRINDTLGHQAGDQVLTQVACRLMDKIHADDTLARLGGDEFALVLRDCGIKGAYQLCDKLLSALREPLILGQQQLMLDIRVGLAEYPRNGSDPQTLMRRANVALHHSKDLCQPITVFDPQLDAYSRDRLALMAEFREALRSNLGLSLHYQPQMRLDDGRIVALEALLRWQHPTRGALPPAEFIPMVEESALISELTRWVISEALLAVARWRRDQRQLRMAVNLSTRNLIDPSLVVFVVEKLGELGLPADALILEITESAIMSNPERAKAVLESLHAMGVVISVDDFGTGYSSLAYLSQLPVSELKIDRSFVQGMMENSSNITIVNATVDLGHNLGLQVVAEGVENASELAALRSIGCDTAQGYLLSKPVNAEEIDKLLASGELLRWASSAA
jgi:diguanylate cyclase (GGDEF)-like protein